MRFCECMPVCESIALGGEWLMWCVAARCKSCQHAAKAHCFRGHVQRVVSKLHTSSSFLTHAFCLNLHHSLLTGSSELGAYYGMALGADGRSVLTAASSTLCNCCTCCIANCHACAWLAVDHLVRQVLIIILSGKIEDYLCTTPQLSCRPSPKRR